MTALPGDVILVRFPFTDLTTTKLRPAVILTTRGDDLTIVGIFSTPSQPARETWIVLSTDDPEFAATGLKTASVIKAERIAVIERSVVVRKFGALAASQMEKLRQPVKLALQLD
jgi:mRNA interferase MazF